MSIGRVKNIAGGLLAAMSGFWLLGIAGADDVATGLGNPEPVSIVLVKVAIGLAGFVIGAKILKGGANE